MCILYGWGESSVVKELRRKLYAIFVQRLFPLENNMFLRLCLTDHVSNMETIPILRLGTQTLASCGSRPSTALR